MAFNEKYVTATGGGLHDGSSEANAWTLSEAASNISAGDRINMKAGTYTLSAPIVFSGVGSSTSPTSLRGYKTTIGDMDEGQASQRVSGTDIPLVQVSGGNYLRWINNASIVENIATEIDSPTTHGIYLNPKGIVRRCRMSITNAPSSVYQANRTVYNTNTQFHDCSFSGGTTGTCCGGNRSAWYGCYFNGGVLGIDGSLQTFVTNCVFSGQSSHAIDFTYGFGPIEGNTFYNIGGNAIDVDNTLGPTSVKNNVFHSITGYAVSQNANDFECFAEGNLYYNCVAGEFSNDSFSLRRDEITSSSDPFTNAAGGDYSLVSGSSGYNGASPKPYDLFDVNSNRDIGAIQHQDPSGGGGATVHPLYAN